MVIALSRFGTFSGLGLSTSSSTDVFPSTPTVTFHGSSYTSDLIAFDGVETNTNQLAASGLSYEPLDTLTAQQQRLMQTFDAPPYTSQAGVIPFSLFGNRYVVIGSSFPPDVLQGKTWQEIASALSDPSISGREAGARGRQRAHRRDLRRDGRAADERVHGSRRDQRRRVVAVTGHGKGPPQVATVFGTRLARLLSSIPYHTFPVVHIGPLSIHVFGIFVGLGILVGSFRLPSVRASARSGPRCAFLARVARGPLRDPRISGCCSCLPTCRTTRIGHFAAFAVWEGGLRVLRRVPRRDRHHRVVVASAP